MTPQLDLYQNIREYIGSGKRVLDFGCGNGFGTIQLLPNAETVHGVDVDEGAIEFARSTLGHLASFGSVSDCPRNFDVVTCVEVIEHVEDVDELLYFIKGRAEGLFIFSTLNHNSQYRKNSGHVGRWRIPEFRSVMEKHFNYVKITDYLLHDDLLDDSTLTPMVAMCRL